MDRMGLGDILRRHRERLGLSQEQLAEAAGAGLSVNTVGNIERGRGRPYRHTLEALADALALSGEEREELLLAAARPPRAADTASARVIPPPSTQAPALPTPATALVGRERETAEVSELLRRPGVRLVTLAGSGGAGKTRLALEAALRLNAVYRDGVRFVDLSPVHDPNQVQSAIAAALGVKEQAGRELSETLNDYLRGKEMLLVLDNLEQVLPAASLIGRILSTAPGLVVLATSRVSLRLYGEHEYQVPTLGLPLAEDLGTVEYSEAVRLFVVRAGAVRPGFELTAENAPTVAEICRRLDGLPLAIELAAARVRIFSPEALLARLGSRLSTLTGGARNLPERQRSLRAALDWSYDLLNEGERALVARLGVFSGGFIPEAAQVVCGAESENLESLLEQSFLLAGEGGGDEPRFRMLETVREYALARLVDTGEDEDSRRRHSEYFLDLAEISEIASHGPHQAQWLRRLDEEHENVRAALSWTRESGRTVLGLRLAVAMAWYWRLRGHWGEALRWFETLLATEAAAELTIPLPLRAKVLNSTAVLALLRGDLRRVEASATESLALFQEVGDAAGTASALNTLGNAAHEQGDYGRAGNRYEASLARYRDLDDSIGVAAVLNDLGVLRRDRGDWMRAMTLHEESLVLRRRLGDRLGIAHSLRNLALVAHLRVDYASAESLLLEALNLFRELGEASAIADALNNLGLLPHVRRDRRRATSLFEESLSVYRQLGDTRGVAWSLNNLGLLAYDRGEYGRAVSLHRESLALRKQLGSRWGAGISLYDLGNALHALGESTPALDAYRESLVLLREAGDEAMMAFALEGLGRAALTDDRPESAVELWGAAEALRASIDAPLPPPDQPLQAKAVFAARTALGDETFERAWQEGRVTPLEMVITEAISVPVHRTDPLK